MADRIDKTGIYDYSRVESTVQAQKDRKGQKEDQQDSDSDQFAKFHEKTDWKIFLDKSRIWKKNVEIRTENISKLIFGKLNLKTDPSLLRFAIQTNDGEVINPAFIAISRAMALKIKHLKTGDEINKNDLVLESVLRVTVPTDPEKFKDPKPVAKQLPTDSQTDKTFIRRLSFKQSLWTFLKMKDQNTNQWRFEIILIYTILFVLAFSLIFGGTFLI